MRNGAIFSGAMHGIALLAVILGLDWLRAEDKIPFRITEVSLVDGEIFEALASAESVGGEAAPEPESSEPAPDAPPPLDEPEEPETAPPPPIPPPPVNIPTEAPRLSLAELPSPDELPEQAARPESKPATEAVQPVSPARPAPAAPRPQPSPETVPEEAEKPERKPEEDAPAEEETAEAQPDAPRSAAPREARLPVAKPADRARAALAARKVEPVAVEEKPVTAERESAPVEDGDSKPVQLALTHKNALQLGIKKHFQGTGNQDRSLWVVVEIRLDRAGRIVDKPTVLKDRGGDRRSREALFRSGWRALLAAEKEGVFAKLPSDKYNAWEVMHIRFSPTDVGFNS